MQDAKYLQLSRASQLQQLDVKQISNGLQVQVA